MNKKVAGIFSLAIILLFMVYMAYDLSLGSPKAEKAKIIEDPIVEAEWSIAQTLKIPFGKLKAVVLNQNSIFVGGENYLAAYKSNDLSLIWNITTEKAVNALSVFDESIYVSNGATISLYNLNGDFIEEWGPYDDEALITSISSNKQYVAFTDAVNKLVFVLNKDGSLKYLFGQPGSQFIVPSPYFDLAFAGDDILAVANPGKRQIEYRKVSGEIIDVFGKEGIGLEEFCGCCNPAHIAFLPNGNIVTAEKGLNRIKILDSYGNLVELVSQSSLFKAAIPLDITTSETGDIYAANRADSILYIFKRNK